MKAIVAAVEQGAAEPAKQRRQRAVSAAADKGIATTGFSFIFQP